MDIFEKKVFDIKTLEPVIELFRPSFYTSSKPFIIEKDGVNHVVWFYYSVSDSLDEEIALLRSIFIMKDVGVKEIKYNRSFSIGRSVNANKVLIKDAGLYMHALDKIYLSYNIEEMYKLLSDVENENILAVYKMAECVLLNL